MMIVELHIPDELAEKVQNLTPDTEAYIINLLRTAVNEKHSPVILEDEYRKAALENTELAKEFAFIDKEGWDDY
jgi:hypothetical protein